MSNIPAFIEEEYAPPSDEMKYRVRFFYEQANIRTEDDFWGLHGREWSNTVGKFTSRSSYVEEQARQAFAPSDSPEQRLRKLYARVQQVDNLSYQRKQTSAEQKTNYRENKNVDDVLRQNAGYHDQITRLFVAMARAAGFEAHVVRVSTRDENFFSEKILDFDQLNSEVALVKVDGKDVYLDPGTKFCPYGLLEWRRSGVKGLVESSNAKPQFVTTSMPDLKNAAMQRIAAFNLSQDGSLKGKVRLAFYGQDALVRRLQENDEDETGRTKDMEDELRHMLPANATVHLDEAKGWEGSGDPLDTLFSVEIPGYASTTGKRLLFSAALFETNRKQIFVHEKRVNPVYFEYPYRVVDQVTYNVPAGLQIESLPKPQKVLADFAGFVTSYESQGQRVVFHRQLDVGGMMYPASFYPKVKSFYEQVKASDDETAILNLSTVAAN